VGRNFLWGYMLTSSAIVAIISAALAVRAYDRASAAREFVGLTNAQGAAFAKMSFPTRGRVKSLLGGGKIANTPSGPLSRIRHRRGQ
jgi:hypothetical protein